MKRWKSEIDLFLITVGSQQNNINIFINHGSRKGKEKEANNHHERVREWKKVNSLRKRFLLWGSFASSVF